MSETKHKDVEKVVVEKEKVKNSGGPETKPRSLAEFAKVHWLTIVSILYVIFPFDFIPDFIPVAGAADDIIVLSFGLYKAYREYKKTAD